MNILSMLDKIEVTSSYIPDGVKNRKILSLCHDSRKASPTSLFFCKVGALTDGHFFAPAAYKNGARLFIAERPLDLPEDAAVIITPNSQKALSVLSVFFYGDPSKSLKMIGITGTKGKTSVALSIYSIASENGVRIGYIGTNGIYYNGKRLETVNTTPDVLELQAALRRMLDDGITTVVLEVSSQALMQERVFGIDFDTCVFTNLYVDHIGKYEHPTFDDYKACKRKLFTDYKVKNIVINADSEHSSYMIEGVIDSNIISTSAKGNSGSRYFAYDSKMDKNGILPGVSYKCHTESGDVSVFMNTPGLHSVENGLCVIAVCSILGIELENIVDGMSRLLIPGRFETVTLGSRPNSLFIIDYAHNGASLSAVLTSLRQYQPERIICLFGSVGGRTFGRRAELGKVVREGADVIIVTSDNPDNEEPYEIINEINKELEGCEKPVYLIEDRELAIKKAVEIAKAGDYVLLAGKGHETYQLVGGKRIPFSEKQILAEADKLELLSAR